MGYSHRSICCKHTYLAEMGFFFRVDNNQWRSSHSMTFPNSVALQPFKTSQPSRGVIVKAQ